MKAFDLGSSVRVTVSEREVDDFARHWPCSGLPESGVGFTFDKRTGDLEDVSPFDADGAALVALAEDAQAYARTRGLLA